MTNESLESGDPTPAKINEVDSKTPITPVKAKKKGTRRWTFASLQSLFVRISILFSLILIIAFTLRELADSSYTIQPFSLPADCIENGYTGEVYSSIVLGKLNQIIEEANNRRTLKELDQYNESSGKVHVNLQVSGVAVSPETISSYIKKLFGVDQRVISGAVIRSDNTLRLMMNISGHSPKFISQKTDSLSLHEALSILSDKAAEEILKSQNHLLAGLYFYEYRRLDEAIDQFRTAVFEQPEYKGTAYAHWGDAVLVSTHDTITPSKLIRKGLKADPRNGTTYRILGNMIGGYSLTKAEWYYRKSVEIDPTSERSWFRLGTVLERDTSRELEAIKCYNKAFTLNKSNTASLFRMVMLFFLRGEYDKASEYLDLLEYLGSDNSSYISVALSEAMGDSVQSLSLIRNSRDRIGLADELNNLAYNQELRGNYKSGFRLARLSLIADSTFALTYTTLAELCELTNDKEGFYLNFEKALQNGLPVHEVERMVRDEFYRKKSLERRFKNLVAKYSIEPGVK